MSFKDYLLLDALFPGMKYEYYDGVVRLMSGGSREHARIAGNMYVELDLQFRSGPGTVYNSDMRVQVAENRFYFPDVTVTCNVEDRRRGIKTVLSPCLVVEVLSPTTEKVDRTEKIKAYQECPTIVEIVLVNQFTPSVEIWRRAEEDPCSWPYAHYESGAEVELTSIDVRLSMEEIYRGLDFDEALAET
ncbi:MAG: Uma2 family endonuclease [Ktedonobacteraceae bacterium]|nr:Uma2 family endonuclease [Ktedonobacteraceae bacterium]